MIVLVVLGIIAAIALIIWGSSVKCFYCGGELNKYYDPILGKDVYVCRRCSQNLHKS